MTFRKQEQTHLRRVFTPTCPAAETSLVDGFIKFPDFNFGNFLKFPPSAVITAPPAPPKKAALSRLGSSLGGSDDAGARDALACERRGSKACQLFLSDKLKLNQVRNHLSSGQYAATFIKVLRSLKPVRY